MKHFSLLVTLVMAFAFTSSVNAQEFLVYSVAGKVKTVQGKTQKEIAPRQQLTMQSIVNFSPGSMLVIIDKEAKKQYTLSGNGTFSIENLIAKSKRSVKSLSDTYLSYLMKQISGKGVLTSKTAVEDAAASIEREAGDSVFSSPTPSDSIVNDTVAKP